MSLAEVVLEIASEIEGELAKAGSGWVDNRWLAGVANQLRRAVKAADSPGNLISSAPPPVAKHHQLLEQEKRRVAAQTAELREQELRAEQGTYMAEVIEADGTSALLEVPGDLPIDARVPIGDKIYIHREQRKLYYDEDLTNSYQATRRRMQDAMTGRGSQ